MCEPWSRCWSRKNRTFHSKSIDRSASMVSSSRGWEMSMSPISAPMYEESGRTVNRAMLWSPDCVAISPSRSEMWDSERIGRVRRRVASRAMRVLLVATYELGHQPGNLAGPAALLGERGHEVRVLDTSIDVW